MLREFIRWFLGAMFSPKAKRRAPVADVPARVVRLPVVRRRVGFAPIDGGAVPLVRPYVIAHERRVEAWRQRERRRALVLATMGIDYVGVGR